MPEQKTSLMRTTQIKNIDAKDIQIGGTHYKDMPFQPIEFIQANKLGFCEGNAIKYICRWRSKNGIEDLKKAIHYLELLIYEEERNYNHATTPRQETNGIPSLDRRVPIWDYSWKWVGPTKSLFL